MSDQSFLSILFNFKSAFKHVTLWSAGGAASIIIASNEPIDVDLKTLENRFENMKDIYLSIKRNSPYEILYHQVLSDPAITDLANAAKLSHTLYHPTLAYQTGRAFFSNQNVGLENLASQYFTQSEQEKTKEDSKTFDSSGEDQLIWQKHKNKLPEEFFDKGKEFLLSNFNLTAGKLSLAKSYIFPENSEERVAKNVKATTEKFRHYHYLQQPNPKILKSDSPNLASELFDRFLYLKSMRETAFLKNVVATVPEKCAPDQPVCFQNKIKILHYLKNIETKEYSDLAMQTEDKAVQEKIEKLFDTMNKKEL